MVYENPAAYACAKNYTVLLTDGEPTRTRARIATRSRACRGLHESARPQQVHGRQRQRRLPRRHLRVPVKARHQPERPGRAERYDVYDRLQGRPADSEVETAETVRRRVLPRGRRQVTDHGADRHRHRASSIRTSRLRHRPLPSTHSTVRSTSTTCTSRYSARRRMCTGQAT